MLRTFEKGVLRKTCMTNMDEVPEAGKKPHTEWPEPLTKIIRVVKSRTGHMKRRGLKRNACGVLVGKPEVTTWGT
jgi:hypothetical protein